MRIHIMTILRRSNDLTFKNLITEMLDIKAGGLLDVGMWTDLISKDDLKHKYSESVTEFATRFINVSTLLREFTPMRIPDRVFLKLLKPQIKGKMRGERSLIHRERLGDNEVSNQVEIGKRQKEGRRRQGETVLDQ